MGPSSWTSNSDSSQPPFEGLRPRTRVRKPLSIIPLSNSGGGRESVETHSGHDECLHASWSSVTAPFIQNNRPQELLQNALALLARADVYVRAQVHSIKG